MLFGQGGCKVLERNRTTGFWVRALDCHDEFPSRVREMRIWRSRYDSKAKRNWFVSQAFGSDGSRPRATSFPSECYGDFDWPTTNSEKARHNVASHSSARCL